MNARRPLVFAIMEADGGFQWADKRGDQDMYLSERDNLPGWGGTHRMYDPLTHKLYSVTVEVKEVPPTP